MTTQVSTPTAARVGLAYREETTRGAYELETRTGTFTAVDGALNDNDITVAAAVPSKFDGLVAGHPVLINGGTLAGETRYVVAVDTSADPHVLTVNGAAFSTDTLTSITVPPSVKELVYKSGGIEDSPSYDEEAGAVISESMRYGHRVVTGFDVGFTVEDVLRIDQKFTDFVPSVMTNNNGWTAQESASRTVTIAVVAGTPDRYTVACATDGWLANVPVGAFVKMTGLVTNSAANGEPYLVTDKDTGTTGQHKITVLGPRALVAEAGVAVTFVRAKYIRDSNTYKTFHFDEFDTGVPFYRRVNGVAISGLEVSCDAEGTASANYSTVVTSDLDYNPKEGDSVSAPYHTTVTPSAIELAMVGANMIFSSSNALDGTNAAYCVTSGAWNMQERYAGLRTTKCGENAHDADNLGGYYNTNFHLNHVNLTGSASFLFVGSTSIFYDRMKRNCKSRIDLKFQEKDCDGAGKVVIFSAPEVTLSFKPSAGENDGPRKAEAEWTAARWSFTDTDGTLTEFVGQISVFE